MTNPSSRSMTLAEWITLTALSLLWGGSFFFAAVALRELPPLTIVAGRVVVAAATLFLVLRVMGARIPRDPGIWAAFVGMGILNNAIPFTLIVWGQSQIASGLAAILNATTPLMTVIVAHFLTADEPLTRNRAFGVALGFVGVLTMIGPDAIAGAGASVIAQCAVLGAALSYACAAVFGRRFRRLGVAPLATAAGQVAVSATIVTPLALVVDRPWELDWPSADVLGALIGFGALSTALAYVLYFRLLASAGATKLSLVTFLIPVSAILLGVGVLGERLETLQIVGMAIIGLSLIMIDGRLRRSRA
ncbi:MAG: DMT family transporter [Salinarimonadaceae bacterium]|nr:MAG: DMT family transporter [Salinarimonadaceae bacterium]